MLEVLRKKNMSRLCKSILSILRKIQGESSYLKKIKNTYFSLEKVTFFFTFSFFCCFFWREKENLNKNNACWEFLRFLFFVLFCFFWNVCCNRKNCFDFVWIIKFEKCSCAKSMTSRTYDLGTPFAIEVQFLPPWVTTENPRIICTIHVIANRLKIY